MTFYRKTGDMFSEPADAFAHGVNTMGSMGAGVAKIVANTWPECKRAYQAVCGSGFDPGTTYPWRDASGIWIYNVASQRYPGKDARPIWLIDGLEAMYLHASRNLVRTISLPLIGGGIGGMDPVTSLTITEAAANAYSDIDTTLWEL